MKAHEIGEQRHAAFKDERLEKDPPAKKSHDPITTNKLKTFSNLWKSSGRVIILKADRSLFGRIIVMAQGQSEDGRHPVSSSWTITLGSVHT